MVSKFLLVSVTLARLYVIGVRRTGDALEKNSPKIWWIQKVVVPLHSQLQRKGGRKCPMRDWRLVTMTSDRSAHRASLETYFIQAFGRQKSIGKKTSPEIWWFEKLVVPLHSQPARKSSSLFTCEEVLSWSSQRGVSLTGIYRSDL